MGCRPWIRGPLAIEARYFGIELDEWLTAELIEADEPFSFQTVTRNRL